MNATARPTAWVRSNVTACAAFVVALASVGLAVLPEYVVEPPAKTVRQELTELAKHLATGTTDSRVDDYRGQLRRLDIAAVVAALIAAGLAVFAIVRRENKTLAGAAIAAAAVALLWEYIVLGVVIVIVGALVLGLISNG